VQAERLEAKFNFEDFTRFTKISTSVRSAIQAYFGQREHFVQAGAILDSKEAPGERGRKNQHEGEYKYLV